MPAAPGQPPRPARSLTADVRDRSDEELATLLRARPDLAIPAPADLTTLVSRAATQGSTHRVLERLDLGRLALLSAISRSDPADLEQLAAGHGLSVPDLAAAADSLWRLALLWRGPAGYHVPRSVTAALQAATTGRKLAAGDATLTGALAAPGLGALMSGPDLPARPAPGLDAGAGAEADTLLAQVEELGALWEADPPRVLRSGGLSVRDLKVVQRQLDLTADRAAFVVELSSAAGLVAADGGERELFAPTPAYDEWGGLPSGRRWSALALAWWEMPRDPGLVGAQGDAGPVSALSVEVRSPEALDARRVTLAELVSLPAGSVTTATALTARVAWRRPLVPGEQLTQRVARAVREAGWLGIAGHAGESAGVTSPGRALVTGDAQGAQRGIQAVLPDPVEQVVVQADLTAVAPGRVEGELAALLRLLTDLESRGGATVHRFTPGSIRRGLDAGWTAEQVIERLTSASRTPLPQPLEYLVRDVARTHGVVRVGAAESYLRSEDVATLDAMLADRTLSPLQLRRLGATVLVSPASGATVLGLLRERGYAPLRERPDGSVIHASRSVRRVTPRPRQVPPPQPVLDDAAAARLIGRMREGEAARWEREQAPRRGPDLTATDPAVTLSLLRDAAADRTRVWVGHTDSDGRVRRLLFRPVRVISGRAYGTVEGSGDERVLSVHRITGVAPA